MTMRVRERLWAGCVGSVLPPLCPAHSKATPNTLTRPRCCAGAPVTPFEHNWVILFRTGGYVCGASLIDEQWARDRDIPAHLPVTLDEFLRSFAPDDAPGRKVQKRVFEKRTIFSKR